jgi:hypothetical protein
MTSLIRKPVFETTSTIVDVSGLAAAIGQSVSISLTTDDISLNSDISGQVVDISGQTVLLGNELSVDISGQVVDISGQTVLLGNELSVDISGQVVDISGQTVLLGNELSVDISGQVVDISGQTVDIVNSISDTIGPSGNYLSQLIATELSGVIVNVSDDSSGVITTGVEEAVQNSMGITGSSYVGNVNASSTYTSTVDLNSYPYVMMSFFSDQSGTLFFDFSNDNTNWNTFPPTGFNISASIHEFHTAVKGPRYFRWRFVNGDIATASIRGYPYYTSFVVGNTPINKNINEDQDTIVVRAIQTGKNPAANFVNEKVGGYATYSTTSLDAAATYDTGIIDVDGFSQILLELFSDVAGSATGTWYADASGNIPVRTFTIPYSGDIIGDINTSSSITFARYVRFIYTNGDDAQSSFLFGLRFNTKALSGQILGIESFIPNNVIANVQRSVAVGKNPVGTYVNENVGGYAFSTNTPLDADASYNSDILDLNGYSQILTELYADTSGHLEGIWYDDVSGTNIVREFTFPYSSDASGNLEIFSAPVFARYLRYKYINSGDAQTKFLFSLRFLTKAISGQILGVESFIGQNMVANLQRSITVGKQPDGDYVNTPANGTAFVNNSTLSAGATYTSDWFDSDGWQTIQLIIVTDKESALDGIEVDFTTNTNVDTPSVTFQKFFTFNDADVRQGYKILIIPTLLDGFRIVYTNGAEAQGSFEIDCVLKVAPENFNYNKSLALLTSDFLSEVALGNVSSYFTDIRYGRNPDVNNTGPEDIWSAGDNFTGQPINFTPATVTVSSSSTADTSGGTGAETIEIIGLKTSSSEFEESETIIMNGTSDVTSSNTWWRITRARVLTAGSGGENAGNITIESTGSGTPVMNYIPVGFNNTSTCAYTVPANNTLLIKKIKISSTRDSAGNTGCVISLRVRESGGVFVTKAVYDIAVGDSTIDDFDGGIVVPAGSDFKLRVDSVNDNNCAISGTIEYVMSRNT